jgi:hypothetical protein
MTNDNQSDDQGSYPAVDVAYEFVLPSYQMLAVHFEAADNRLTTVPLRRWQPAGVFFLALSLSHAIATPVLPKDNASCHC